MTPRPCRPEAALARDLSIPLRTVKFAGRRVPDIRKVLADLCRRRDPYDPAMERMARRLEALGPPE